MKEIKDEGDPDIKHKKITKLDELLGKVENDLRRNKILPTTDLSAIRKKLTAGDSQVEDALKNLSEKATKKTLKEDSVKLGVMLFGAYGFSKRLSERNENLKEELENLRAENASAKKIKEKMDEIRANKAQLNSIGNQAKYEADLIKDQVKLMEEKAKSEIDTLSEEKKKNQQGPC